MRVPLPGVGKNLQDRYEVGIVAQTERSFGLLADATFEGPAPKDAKGDPPFEQWRESSGRGLYASNGAVIGFTARSSVAEHNEPDLFIFGVPGEFTGYYTDWSKRSVAAPHNKWTWLLLKAHARFRGRVTLDTADPLDPPRIDFNYFERGPDGRPTESSRKDLVAMREGVRFVNTLLEGSRELLHLHPKVMAGVDLQSDQGIDEFVQDRAWGHHASCTCKIGGDGDDEAGTRLVVPGARCQGIARRRRLGLPADSRLLHRQRDLHDRGEGCRRDSGRREARIRHDTGRADEHITDCFA